MEKMIRPGELANILNVSRSTLRVWDKAGTLKAHRTPGGKRYYLESEVTLWQQGYPFSIKSDATKEQIDQLKEAFQQQHQPSPKEHQPIFISVVDRLEDK